LNSDSSIYGTSAYSVQLTLDMTGLAFPAPLYAQFINLIGIAT